MVIGTRVRPSHGPWEPGPSRVFKDPRASRFQNRRRRRGRPQKCEWFIQTQDNMQNIRSWTFIISARERDLVPHGYLWETMKTNAMCAVLGNSIEITTEDDAPTSFSGVDNKDVFTQRDHWKGSLLYRSVFENLW